MCYLAVSAPVLTVSRDTAICQNSVNITRENFAVGSLTSQAVRRLGFLRGDFVSVKRRRRKEAGFHKGSQVRQNGIIIRRSFSLREAIGVGSCYICVIARQGMTKRVSYDG